MDMELTKNYVEAIKWFKKSADLGNAEAMNNIGRLYHYQPGFSIDYTEAMRWYVQAIDFGNADANAHIGNLYYDGFGGK